MGGARKGAGKPKGVKWPSTLAKEQARELVRQAVTKELQPMIDAQVAHSKGLKYLVTRNKAGKFTRVTEAMAKALTGSDDEIVEVWEKDPSVQAFSDLLNRALDKPKEQAQELDVNVKDAGFWDGLAAARKRAKKGEV